jgi:hypothetical protein
LADVKYREEKHVSDVTSAVRTKPFRTNVADRSTHVGEKNLSKCKWENEKTEKVMAEYPMKPD